jgi:hypothetical protein
MTTLYRSPNVMVDGVRWHVAVERRRIVGKPIVCYRFQTTTWKSVHHWPGRLPKALYKAFKPYRRHVNVALVDAGSVNVVEQRMSLRERQRRGQAMVERAAA